MSDWVSIHTFTDSEVFGVIYFYSYALVILVILFGAAYFATKVPLFYHTHQLLDEITSFLSKITLAIRKLDKKNKLLQKYSKVEYVREEVEAKKNIQLKLDKMQGISKTNVKLYVHLMFEQIHQLFDKHEKYLFEKIDNYQYLKEDRNDNIKYNINYKNKQTQTETFNSYSLAQTQESDFNSNSNKNLTSSVNTYDVDLDIELKFESKLDSNDNNNNSNSNKNNNSNDNHNIDSVVTYINDQHQKGEFVSFFQTVYRIRSLLFPALTHLFDTTTDIALVWEWYILYQIQNSNGSNISNINLASNLDNINMFAFFISSLSVLIYYRISSSWEVYQFTQNKFDSILQFLFDFFLIKLIYINIFKMKSYKSSQIIKQWRMIEGGNESAFQSILTLVFLIKTQFNQTTTVAYISLAASLLSLVSRLSLLDKNSLKDKAKEFDTNNNTIHKEWLFHRLFRLIEILFSIFLISIFWDIVGGMWLLFLFLIGIVNIYVQYQHSGDIRTDWFNYILAININEIGDLYHYPSYYCDSCDSYMLTGHLRARLIYLRTAMIIPICMMLFINWDNSLPSYYTNDNNNNDLKLKLTCILCGIHILLLFMTYIVIRFLILKSNSNENKTNRIIEKFRVFDYIGNNNENCVLFCKYLKCNIFNQSTRLAYFNNNNSDGNNKQCLKFSCEKTMPNDEFDEPSNIIEALLKSGDCEYYGNIINEWYYQLYVYKNNKKTLTLMEFLKSQQLMLYPQRLTIFAIGRGKKNSDYDYRLNESAWKWIINTNMFLWNQSIFAWLFCLACHHSTVEPLNELSKINSNSKYVNISYLSLHEQHRLWLGHQICKPYNLNKYNNSNYLRDIIIRLVEKGLSLPNKKYFAPFAKNIHGLEHVKLLATFLIKVVKRHEISINAHRNENENGNGIQREEVSITIYNPRNAKQPKNSRPERLSSLILGKNWVLVDAMAKKQIISVKDYIQQMEQVIAEFEAQVVDTNK